MMTLGEIRSRIWENLGKPTNLDPATGVDRNNLTIYANEGQRAVANWKDPQRERPIRFHCLYNSFDYHSTVVTGTITAVNNTTVPYSITVSGLQAEADRYNEWVVEVTSGSALGEIKYIVDNGTLGVLYLQEAFNIAPSVSDTVSVYKRFDNLLSGGHAYATEHIIIPTITDRELSTGNFLEPLSIISLKNKNELQIVEKEEKYPTSFTANGDPTTWYRYGNRIYYDKAIDSYQWFRLEYYRQPTNMLLDTDYPELPEAYHMAIVLYGTWFGLRTKMESSKAWATKQDFESTMRSTVNEFDVRKERINLYGEVRLS
jgi:hypothetical protein